MIPTKSCDYHSFCPFLQYSMFWAFHFLANWVRELCREFVFLCLDQQEYRKNRTTCTCIFEAMDRVLFAGLQILSVLSFTAHASSSRPHIIFILADDLVSMILISSHFYVEIKDVTRACVNHCSYWLTYCLLSSVVRFTTFLVLPNFHSCFYNSTETRYMFSIS